VDGFDLLRIVENDTNGNPLTSADPADAVAQLDHIISLCALNRSTVDGEGDGITLPQWDDFCPALPARTLLRQYELSAREIAARFGK
jgi:hypothetical protein